MRLGPIIIVEWESDGGDIQVTYHHERTDPEGCALELRRRQDIETLQDDTDLTRLIMDRGNAANEFLIPIPNTTDALGVLKGEVDLSPSYRRFGECGKAELGMIREFFTNYASVLSQEAEAARKYAKGLAC